MDNQLMITLVSYEYSNPDLMSDPSIRPDLEIVRLTEPYRGLQPGFYIYKRSQPESLDFPDYAIGEFGNPRNALRYYRKIYGTD